MLFPRSCRATWTRSTRTSFAGYPWKSRSSCRTAARPRSAMTASTETSLPRRQQRSSTTRRPSPRTTRRRARRNKSTTRLSSGFNLLRHTGTLSGRCGGPQVLGRDCPITGPNCDQWEDQIKSELELVSRSPLGAEWRLVQRTVSCK